jgi:hypothetical protein
MLRRDPLFHFLVIGGVLFAALSLLDRGEDPGEILITAERIAELERSASLLQGRPPTEDELGRLVADVVREEVYYRQALALGLDDNDTVVRQRLVEKMRELAENVVDPVPPEADIEAWFEANAWQFRIPELVSFDHVFFSPRDRGDGVAADASSAREALAAGGDPSDFGDATPLGVNFAAADAARVRTLFDEPLTEAVFAAMPGEWIGPFESGFGWHVVRVTARTPARDPAYAEIEAQVRDAYAREQLARANAAAFEEMQGNFDIAVEWEAGSEPERWP